MNCDIIEVNYENNAYKARYIESNVLLLLKMIHIMFKGNAFTKFIQKQLNKQQST